MADARITVNLNRRGEAALESAGARERLSKTEVVNRALQVYDFITEQTEGGRRTLALIEGDDVVEVKLL